MESEKYTLASLRQDIIDNNLHAKAIIQDILKFRGSIIEIETLNEAGRAKLSALRKCIERLDDWARDDGDPELCREVDAHRDQFSRTLQAFRKANVSALLEIEKAEKQDLFASSADGGASEVRQRTTKHTRSGLISQQDSVTDKMLSISRHLSETTQRSAATLDTLVASSSSVDATRDELQNTAGTISQSGKLLKKYGRRDCTDKVLLFIAFGFFLACVFYIVQKRLF